MARIPSPHIPYAPGSAVDDPSVPALVTWAPHLFSLLGLMCGFFSLLAATAAEFSHAAAFIIAAVLFDGFDGAAARAVRSEGPFGESLDSLADVVSFGVAPAYLVYQAHLHLYGTPGAFAGAAFVACGAVRLARFPLVKRDGYFLGLPIPMAGAFVAMLGVYATEVPPVVVPAVTIVVAFLMVSTIHFPYFSTALRPLPQVMRLPVCLALAPILFILAPKTILFLLALYLTLGPVRAARLAPAGHARTGE